MSLLRPCDRCGTPAARYVVNDGSGTLTTRYVCLRCLDAEQQAASVQRRGLNHSAVVMVIGAHILFLSLTADWFPVGASEGFGWRQASGVLLGIAVVFCGALIRIPTLLVIGGGIGGISLLADWLELGGAEGFGTQQRLGTAIGAAMLLVGTAMHWGTRAIRSRRSPAVAPARTGSVRPTAPDPDALPGQRPPA